MFNNWRLLATYSVLMGISMNLPIFGGSIVNTAMARSLGWDATALGLLVVANMVAASVLLPVAAKAIGRVGLRPSMMAGFLMMALGALALSTIVTKPIHAVLAYGVAMGFTSAFSGVIQCQTGVAAYFPTRRTLAFSILYAGTGIASFCLLTLISHATGVTGNWRTGWHVVALAAAVGIALVVFGVREPRTAPRADGAPDGAPSPAGPSPPPGSAAVYPGLSLGEVFRMPLFWIIALSMIAITAGSIVLAAQAQVYLIRKGFAPSDAAMSMSLLQIGMILGNLGLGFIAPRIQLHRAMALAFLSYALSFFLLANVQGQAMLVAFAVLAGVGYGAGQVGAMALIGYYWDLRIVPMLTATGLMIQTIGSSAAPILAGKYYDQYGSLLPPIYFMVVLFLALSAALAIFGANRTAKGAFSVLANETKAE